MFDVTGLAPEARPVALAAAESSLDGALAVIEAGVGLLEVVAAWAPGRLYR